MEWNLLSRINIMPMKFPVWINTLLLLATIRFGPTDAVIKGKLMVPNTYTALTSDLHIQLHVFELPTNLDYTDLKLRISKFGQRNETSRIMTSMEPTIYNGMVKTIVTSFNIAIDPRLNVTQIAIPCNTFMTGGLYELELINPNEMNVTSITNDVRLRQQLDVRWPVPQLTVSPQSIGTYPSDAVQVVIEFPSVDCVLNNHDNNLPELWLQLIYCGHDIICNSNNITKSQILYAEQIRGYPKARIIKLRCDLFGLAGHYVVWLKSNTSGNILISSRANIKVDWSEKYVFNVHARSIFPCDPHSGIGVLFEYPSCILDQADRVRLYAKLRADVASLAPPTSMHYISEQRVIRGQHSLHFDCDLFTEKYVEYCFVYVSQGISGAVADIRMDCLPTLPVTDVDMGGWSDWSEWTPCSTTCSGGIRSRYRVCDSPPPRYGAKFCEGNAVETERCGESSDRESWDCLYNTGNSVNPSSVKISSDSREEIATECRCGCIVHLGQSRPSRSIATSSQSCPGRTFWLIQADGNNHIRFHIEFFRMSCYGQYLKIRDGDSLRAELLAEFIAGEKEQLGNIIYSTGPQMLIEFYTEEMKIFNEQCNSAFLARIQQIYMSAGNNTLLVADRSQIIPVSISQVGGKLTLIHIVAIIFAFGIILISSMLGVQYVCRYRKYQLTGIIGEEDSPAHTPTASLDRFTSAGQLTSRAVSTSTLISEVISLVRVRPKVKGNRHSVLRESVDCEALEKNNDETNYDSSPEALSDRDSLDSNATLTNSNSNNSNNLNSNTNSNSVSKTQSIEADGEKSLNDDIKDIEKDKDETEDLIPGKVKCLYRKPRGISGTPMPLRRQRSKTMGKSEILLKRRMKLDAKEKECDTDTELSSVENSAQLNRISACSNSTLTNCYSPVPSISSVDTMTATLNIKESKEKRNRAKLLAGPGSEFSLANPEELEMDYYDYNVTNAGAAPGSYLGMDPAYLVWIPPIEGEEESSLSPEPVYEEINESITNSENSIIEQSVNSIPDEFSREEVITPVPKENRKSLVTAEINEKESNSKINIDEKEKEKDMDIKPAPIKSTTNKLENYYDIIDDIQYADEDDSSPSISSTV